MKKILMSLALSGALITGAVGCFQVAEVDPAAQEQADEAFRAWVDLVAEGKSIAEAVERTKEAIEAGTILEEQGRAILADLQDRAAQVADATVESYEAWEALRADAAAQGIPMWKVLIGGFMSGAGSRTVLHLAAQGARALPPPWNLLANLLTLVLGRSSGGPEGRTRKKK